MFILVFVDVHNLVSLVTLRVYINQVQKILITYVEFFAIYVKFKKILYLTNKTCKYDNFKYEAS